MPANLTPDYLAAERAFREAQTPQERVAALEEMLAALPKHKGTEKLQADLRRRISNARKESQKKSGGHSTPAYIVRREGAGQAVLVGPPNSGKSQLVASLTHAHPEVGDYPFTTHLPVAGMMPFEDILIQLVDLPAIDETFTEPWLSQVIRGADLSVLVMDPNDAGVLGEIDYITETLARWRCPMPGLLAVTKMDLAGSRDNLEPLRELYCQRFDCVGVSALTGEGLPEFAARSFAALGIVRFYSKPPGRKPDLSAPYVLRRGETVQDAAARVHRDFGEHLKFARLFRSGDEHGMMVDRNHAVEDRDILEFHA